MIKSDSKLKQTYIHRMTDTERLDWLDSQIFEDAEPFPAIRIFEEDGGVILECPIINGRCAGGIGGNLREAIDAANPRMVAATTADPKPKDIGGNELPDRIEANKDFYEVNRNDFDRGDLRDEGRNPDGSGLSYGERQ